jgi:hypothetical protein
MRRIHIKAYNIQKIKFQNKYDSYKNISAINFFSLLQIILGKSIIITFGSSRDILNKLHTNVYIIERNKLFCTKSVFSRRLGETREEFQRR